MLNDFRETEQEQSANNATGKNKKAQKAALLCANYQTNNRSADKF